jgi:hypothetical protein
MQLMHGTCRADVSQLIALASRQFNSGNQAWGFPVVRDLSEIIACVFPEASLTRAQEIEREVGMASSFKRVTCDV